jgi:hypothetical protein
VAYAVFIFRTGFAYGGRRYFVLFDDAMISMRYAANLAHGHGLRWNTQGPEVEGYSNLLWTAVMAVPHLAGVGLDQTSLVMMMLAAVVLLLELLAVRALVDRLLPGRTAPGMAAMVLVGFHYSLVFWTLRGMEVGIVSLELVLAMLAAMDVVAARAGALPRLAALVGALLLTRDDTLLACVLIWLFLAWQVPAPRRTRVLAVSGGAIAAVLAVHTAFRVGYYGSALPNTYYLKLAGIPLSQRLLRGSITTATTIVNETWLVLLLAVVALVRRARLQPVAVLLAAEFLAFAAYTTYVGGDAWEYFGFSDRYLATAAPLLAVLAVSGLADLRALPQERRNRVALLVVALAVVVAALQLPGSPVAYSGPGVDPQNSIVRAVLALSSALVAAIALRAPAPAGRVAPQVLAVAALLLTLSGVPSLLWVKGNASSVEDLDWTRLRYGLIQAADTNPRASIAVYAAGTMPYVSGRQSVDILGKSDVVVAHGPQMGAEFPPGHQKWNYQRSFCQLRPDLVAELRGTAPADLDLLASCGYAAIPGRHIYVRVDSANVDRDRLRADLDAMARDMPYAIFLH